LEQITYGTEDKVPDYLDPASRTDYIKALVIISSLEAKAKEGARY
jgi:hypothetical protein